jgi:hypothetical protein
LQEELVKVCIHGGGACRQCRVIFFFWHYSPWWILASSKIVLFCPCRVHED